ncbi:hypothetical protein HaLaN_18466, partial [Haematococcus lacustris]
MQTEANAMSTPSEGCYRTGKVRCEGASETASSRLVKNVFRMWHGLLAGGVPRAKRIRSYKVQLVSTATNSKELRAEERRSIGGAWSAGAIVSLERRSNCEPGAK